MISSLAEFHFIRPAWLLLLPLAVGIWWIWQRYSDPLRGWREQISADLLDSMVVGKKKRSQLSATWLIVGWITTIVAIAGPTWQLEPSPFAEDSTPLLIVLKADSSMEESDLAPSRLEHARLKIVDLAEARKGQPLGLIAYAGSAHLVLPPTRDTSIVASMAAEISPEIMPVPGDRLDLAIAEGVRIVTEGKKGGSIVVFADEVDTDSGLLKQIETHSVPVQFLAINGSPVTPPNLTAAASVVEGIVETLALDGSDITKIVRRAAGKALPAEDELSNQWQESGYWLVPVVALILLTRFRRQKEGVEV